MEKEVVELKKNEILTKKKAVEEYKSSEIFQEAVESIASKYFSEGFNFYKGQLAHYHPNLGIDLDGMGLDHDVLKEVEDDVKDEEVKRRATKKRGGEG